MKLRSVGYLTGMGIHNVKRNWLMSVASYAVLLACMVIFGIALLVYANLNVALKGLEQQNVVMVYMKDYSWAMYSENGASSDDTDSSAVLSVDDVVTDNISNEDDQADENGIKQSDYYIHNDEEAQLLCDKIANLSNVADVEYISAEQGLEEVTDSMMSSVKDYFSDLSEGNPLSAAAKVTMSDMSLFDSTLSSIEAMDEVDCTLSYGELANKITSIKSGIRTAGLWIFIILAVISFVIVTNTIRVTLFSRKCEIKIMKAVGATNAFIRFPFIVEGILIGMLSAVSGEVIVYAIYRTASESISSILGASSVVPFNEWALILFAAFSAIGILSGLFGSVLILRIYLNKEGSEFAAF